MIRASKQLKRGVQFRPLNVAVFHDGQLERFEMVPDPRERMCEVFNQDPNNQQDGYTAYPVSSYDTKVRPGAKWQVIVIDRGRPRCYLSGVPCRVATDWAIAFNDELQRRELTDVRAFACSCSGDTTIEKAPTGKRAAKRRHENRLAKGGAA